MRFFRKVGPRTPIFMPNGDPLKFETLDGKTGYYKTEDAGYLVAFDKCIREDRGGLTEINEETYENDFAKKKIISPPYVERLVRETLGGGPSPDTAMRPRPSITAGAVQVSVGPAVPPLALPAPAAPAPEETKASPKQRVGRRPNVE